MDLFILKAINGLAGKNKILDYLGIFFAKYFEFILWLFFLLFFYNNISIIFSVILISIFSRFAVALPIGFFWKRKRPYKVTGARRLIREPWWFSFPSGHSSFYFALATAVLFFNIPLGVFFLISAFLISLARVFCGVHWPSDILAGALIGVLCGIILYL